MKKFHYYVGIDVSKLTLDITVLYEQEGKHRTEYCKIQNNQKSIAQFVKKNLKNYNPEQLLFCFENTGIYSLPLTYYLNDNKQNYWCVPSMEIKRSRGICRGKDDKIDSKAIAFYALTHTHKFSQSKLPSKAIQKLKILFTYREQIQKSIALFSKTDENKGFVSADMLKLVSNGSKSIIVKLKNELKSIEKNMLEIIASQEELTQQYKLITDIPGVGMQTAIYIIVLTNGFENFQNWRKLACYAGVAPFPYQSGTSIRGRNKVHPMANKKLKSLLNMCALSVIRFDKEIKEYYKRKVDEGKHKMLVLNNIRCKILSRVFAVVKRGTPYVDTHKFVA